MIVTRYDSSEHHPEVRLQIDNDGGDIHHREVGLCHDNVEGAVNSNHDILKSVFARCNASVRIPSCVVLGALEISMASQRVGC